MMDDGNDGVQTFVMSGVRQDLADTRIEYERHVELPTNINVRKGSERWTMTDCKWEVVDGGPFGHSIGRCQLHGYDCPNRTVSTSQTSTPNKSLELRVAELEKIIVAMSSGADFHISLDVYGMPVLVQDTNIPPATKQHPTQNTQPHHLTDEIASGPRGRKSSPP